MDVSLRERLTRIARERTADDDPSHDFGHITRVLANAEHIARAEGADLDIVIPAALFHDIVNYPKNDPRAAYASDESAAEAAAILSAQPAYPKEKIPMVSTAIAQCSFSKAIVPELLESKVLQDADMLEATGAISIMRTFATTGTMRRPFYDPQDPFCKERSPDGFKYAVDLFYLRLLKVQERMHTKTGRELCRRRTHFLHEFLKELERELDESAASR